MGAYARLGKVYAVAKGMRPNQVHGEWERGDCEIFEVFKNHPRARVCRNKLRKRYRRAGGGVQVWHLTVDHVIYQELGWERSKKPSTL